MISQEKIKEWVGIFINHINDTTPELHVRDQEGYKFQSVNLFQKNFDIDVPELYGMLEKSIDNNNLVVGNMYFPRKMLLHYIGEDSKKVREILCDLFDEKKPVADRLTIAHQRIEEMNNARNTKLGESAKSFIGLRFLSVLLGYHQQQTCNPIKPHEWRVFCKYIDDSFSKPSHLSAGEQYELFNPYIEKLRRYIQTLPQIRILKDKLTKGLEFQDREWRWITQDIIYVTARIIAEKRSKEMEFLEPKNKTEMEEEQVEKITVTDSLSPEMQFPLEEYLENFMIRNWDNIDFGEDLEIYYDDDGSPGQQFATEVGILDILAKDKLGNFVVIELKRDSSRYDVVGQILSYISWVKDNLASNGEKVRGLIIVNRGTPALHAAAKAVKDIVSVKYYRVNLDLMNPDDVKK